MFACVVRVMPLLFLAPALLCLPARAQRIPAQEQIPFQAAAQAAGSPDSAKARPTCGLTGALVARIEDCAKAFPKVCQGTVGGLFHDREPGCGTVVVERSEDELSDGLYAWKLVGRNAEGRELWLNLTESARAVWTTPTGLTAMLSPSGVSITTGFLRTASVDMIAT